MNNVKETSLELSNFPIDMAPLDIELISPTTENVDVCISIYSHIAKKWHWNGKLKWGPQDWITHFHDNKVIFYLLKKNNEYLGFFELNILNSEILKIKYIALLDAFVGLGYGKQIISEIKRIARKISVSKIIVETRDLDHPNALKAYLTHGFVIKEEKFIKL